MRDYAQLDAIEIAGLVRAGHVSQTEVVEAALAEVERQNPALNAMVEVYADQALKAAAGRADGPLAGVPVLLKDLGCPAKGTRTSYGSALFVGAPAWEHDSLVVSKLRAAGAIILGRTTSAEFGVSLTTEPAFFGAAQNPKAPGHSPGGSSGGSASAVAAGIAPIAHATDGCGSIRVPAAHCGIFGLKPTRGRVSLAPDASEGWAGMSCVGGLTRSVRDTALLLDVIKGPGPGDPHVPPEGAASYVQELGQPIPRLRIGLLREAPNGVPVDRPSRQALEAAATLCEQLGHRVEEITADFDLEEAIPHFAVIWGAQLLSVIEPRYQALGRAPDGSGLEAFSWSLAARAAEHGSADYAAAVRYIHAASRRLASSYEGWDLILSPVSARSSVPLGLLAPESHRPEAYLSRLFETYPFTVQFNITGQPAFSAPTHWTDDGQPVGVQIAAAFGNEALLLAFGAHLEALQDWRGARTAAARPKEHAALDRDHGQTV